MSSQESQAFSSSSLQYPIHPVLLSLAPPSCCTECLRAARASTAWCSSGGRIPCTMHAYAFVAFGAGYTGAFGRLCQNSQTILFAVLSCHPFTKTARHLQGRQRVTPLTLKTLTQLLSLLLRHLKEFLIPILSRHACPFHRHPTPQSPQANVQYTTS